MNKLDSCTLFIEVDFSRFFSPFSSLPLEAITYIAWYCDVPSLITLADTYEEVRSVAGQKFWQAIDDANWRVDNMTDEQTVPPSVQLIGTCGPKSEHLLQCH